MAREVHLDPVLAYDRLAPRFGAVSQRRRDYLSAVDQLIIAEIPDESTSLLDVGAGDGARALHIARSAHIHDPVLLEPSAEMRRQWPSAVSGWPIRAEELSEKSGSFDVVLCLWNVLGHIFPAAARVEVLTQCARLLAPKGRMFVDVNHRYNAAHYGLFRTALRMLKDRIVPRESNGDVVVRWEVDGTDYVTEGHVFTCAEFRRIAYRAGLVIEKQFNVSYSTGEVCKSEFAANPLFILRRA